MLRAESIVGFEVCWIVFEVDASWRESAGETIGCERVGKMLGRDGRG